MIDIRGLYRDYIEIVRDSARIMENCMRWAYVGVL